MAQSTAQKKQKIYVVCSGQQPLHAVYTERQAKHFIEQYGHPTDDCRLFLGFLTYHKITLIPPRKMKAKQLEGIKKVLSKERT